MKYFQQSTTITVLLHYTVLLYLHCNISFSWNEASDAWFPF